MRLRLQLRLRFLLITSSVWTSRFLCTKINVKQFGYNEHSLYNEQPLLLVVSSTRCKTLEHFVSDGQFTTIYHLFSAWVWLNMNMIAIHCVIYNWLCCSQWRSMWTSLKIVSSQSVYQLHSRLLLTLVELFPWISVCTFQVKMDRNCLLSKLPFIPWMKWILWCEIQYVFILLHQEPALNLFNSTKKV